MINNKALNFISNLSDNQKSLLDALAEQNDNLRTMYYGALVVLKDADNPERLVLAAHGIRELMEKIPMYVNVSIDEPTNAGNTQYNLKQQVNELRDMWNSSVANNASFDEGRWIGEIDGDLQRFLDKCQIFFEKYQEERPTRLQEMATALHLLDKSGYLLPEPLQEKNIRNLKGLRDFFQAVSHHRNPCSEDEFYYQLEKFEGFLLDRLVPRIFADFDEIDEIIREGNTDG